MKNLTISSFLSSFTLSLFLFLCVGSANAAATDCAQTASDGQINCMKSNDYWNGTTAVPAATTYMAYKNSAIAYVCSLLAPSGYTCGEKTTTGPIDGRACDSFLCSAVSTLASDNKSGTGVYYRYRTDFPDEPYTVYQLAVDHKFTCPANFTQITPDVNYGLRYCKPTSLIQTTDSSCPLSGCKETTGTQKMTGSTTAGDPIDVASGNKYVIENDYNYNAYWPLSFNRSYNAKTGLWLNNWTFTLNYSDFSPVGKVISVTLPNGTSWVYKYNGVSNLWEPTNLVDVNKLTFNATTGEFTYTLDNNVKVLFAPKSGTALSNSNIWSASKLTMIGGGEYTFSYDTNGYLNKVANPNGVELVINQSITQTGCANNPVVTSIVAPGALTTTYTYNTSCYLTKVTYPDATFKTYEYNSSGQILKIKDELNNVMQNTTYTSSLYRLGNSASTDGLGSTGAIDKIGFTYANTTTTVKDAFNNAVVITVAKQNNQTKPTAYNTLCTWCDGIQGSSISYNTNGFITSVTDFNGNITEFSYDTTRNLLTRIKQSVNNATFTRQTDITYDTTYKLPLTVTEPSSILVAGSYNNRVTTNTYDSTTGRLTQKTVTAPGSDVSTTPVTKTWNYVYGTLGQLTEIQNPRYVTNSGAINDKIVNTYNTNGQVSSVTNGLGQTMSFSNFDNYGQPQTVTYPDATTMTLTYNSRGKVTSMTKNGLYTTTIGRNVLQLVERITSPSGAYKDLVYDTTQHLSEVKEYNESAVYQGKTVFTLDNMSNLTKVQVLDAADVEIRVASKQYNTKNQLFKDLTSLNYATTYTYDNNGNINNINDANNKNIVYTYDSLNRIATQTNPDLGVITYGYNPDDSVASVTAPTSQTTSYKYNGFGEVIKLTSPDTGVSSINRDIAGNVLTNTDARSITATYTYDAINRPLTITYPTTAENVTMTYDTCTNGIGKLCSIIDVAGTTSYTYDALGHVTSKTNTIGLVSKTVSYAYDSTNRLNKMTYPSGMEVNYTYSNNKPVTVTYKIGAVTSNIMTNGVYDPSSNEIKSYAYGNGATYTKTFNKDGLVSAIATSVAGLNVNQGYGFDTRLNINAITGSGATTVTYDDNSRIKTFNGTTYNYTTNGNRTSVVSGTTTTYNNGTGNNKLLSLSGGATDTFGYDNIGNQITATGKTFSYNDAGAMKGYTDSTRNYSYLVNSLGERIKKTDNTTPVNNVIFTYHSGQLLGEYDNVGIATEYVYIGGNPIAVVKNNVLYNIYNDQLGTPRTVTDTSNNVVWKWDNSEVFGNNLPSISTLTFNLRFAGQYFDNESNLHYNYYRTYNPKTGKYLSSDPIGLDGGLNTYGYVGGNSLSYIDPLGLVGVNYGLNNGSYNVFFDIEESVKMRFTNKYSQSNILYILSHGSQNSLSGFTGEQIAQQIISGEFLVNNSSMPYKNNYFQNMLQKGKDITIVLDACNVASPNIQNDMSYPNFTQVLGKALRNNLPTKYSHIKINIIAPSGAAGWTGSANPLSDSISPMYYSIDGKQQYSNGKWENFKF